MPTLHDLGYQPPYDSPIEEMFAWTMAKHLGDTIRMEKQVEVETQCGTFRLDHAARTPGGRLVAFECDGQDYHDDSFRDQCRDALILGVEKQAVIYRLRGPDLYYRMDDCLYVISQKDPALFSPRGLRNIELLASDEVKSAVGSDFSDLGDEDRCGYEAGHSTMVFYRDYERQREFSLVVERRTCESVCGPGVLAFLKFALAQPSGTTFTQAYMSYRKKTRAAKPETT